MEMHADALPNLTERGGGDADSGGGGAGDANGDVRIRIATRQDMPHVIQMIQELAEYEGVPDGPRLSVDDLIRDGFESTPAWFFVLLAERRGELVGQAMCNRAYSSWTGRAFYLEDLYVRPHARRAGVGRRLMTRICQMARAEGVRRVDWHVLVSNAPAHALYARCGARDLRISEGRTAMRLDAAQIRDVVDGRLLPAPTPPHDQPQ